MLNATKGDLKAFLNDIANYPSQGAHSALLQDLISKGLLDDIDQSPYVFSKKCQDDSGEEMDASTLRGVRNAPICINIPKLASVEPSSDELAGLMMHEHVRHFGIEDTDYAGLHPLAIYVSDYYDYLMIGPKAFMEKWNNREAWKKDMAKIVTDCTYSFAQPLLKDVTVNRCSTSLGLPTLAIYSTDPQNAKLVIENIEGDCPKKLYTGVDQKTSVRLHLGQKLPLDRSYYSLELDGGFWGRVSESCKISLSIENAYGKAEIASKFSPYYSNHPLLIAVSVSQIELSDEGPHGKYPTELKSLR